MDFTTQISRGKLDLSAQKEMVDKAKEFLKAGKNQKDKKALMDACRGMESIFLNMMLKEMRKTIPKGGLFPDSLAKDIYTSMFDQQVCDEMTRAGKGIGIAEMLFEYFSEVQHKR